MTDDRLPPSLLEAVAAHGSSRSFRANTILLNEGDPGASLYIVLDGRLRAYASSAQMIYREPVVYEIPLVSQPTLFIIGADDHNAPGKANAPEALRPKMGQNAALAQSLAASMPNAHAEVIPNAGHLVFLDARAKYDELMLGFLGK